MGSTSSSATNTVNGQTNSESIVNQDSNMIDPIQFRNALGIFATGVTVISAQCDQAVRIGVTANSFNSVSLDPPMVLWSLAKTSKALQLFQSSGNFCVNVLAADQVSLSNHFASKRLDKFADVEYQDGLLGSPVLLGCAAAFECKTAFTYEGGDHLIFVGEVVKFHQSDKKGLLYHAGKYAVSNPHPATGLNSAKETTAPAGFVDDYLDYLLSKAADNFEASFQPHLDRRAITRFEWRTLVTLNDRNKLSLQETREIVLLNEKQQLAVLKDLIHRDLVAATDGSQTLYSLTQKGEEEVIHLLAAAKSHEVDAMGNFSLDEARTLKSLLQRLV